jgi:hypothetical protein
MLGMTSSPASLSLHAAAPADARDVARLAALDEVAPLQGPVFIARIDGRPVAAYSGVDGRVAADPFTRSADAVVMLRRFAGSASRRRFGFGRGPLGLAA